MARRTGGTVHLCRICAPLDPAAALPPPARLCWARAHSYLLTVARRLAATFGVRVRVGVRAGSPAESVLREAELVGAELIVLTIHGQGESGPSWIGATADEIVHRADCAVLLLPGRQASVDWTTGAFGRILVPVDETVVAESVLGGTADLRRHSGATYCLLPLPAASTTTGGTAPSPASDRALRAAEEWIRRHGERTLPPRLNGYAPAPAVMYAAREFRADLIAFALPAKLGRDPEVFDPLLERLIRLSPFPLLLHRPSVRRVLDVPGLTLPSADAEPAPGASP